MKYKIGDLIKTEMGGLFALVTIYDIHYDEFNDEYEYRCNAVDTDYDAPFPLKHKDEFFLRERSSLMELVSRDYFKYKDEPEEIKVGDMVSDNCQHSDESTRRYGIVTKIDNHEQLVVMNSHNCFCLRMHKSSWDKQPSDKKFEAQRKLWKAWQDSPDKHADYPDDTKPMKCPGTEQSNFATCDDSGGIPAQEPKKEEEILITDLLESKVTSQPGMFIGRFMDFESGKQGVEIVLADGMVAKVYNTNLVKSKMNKHEWIEDLLRSYKTLRGHMDSIQDALGVDDSHEAMKAVYEDNHETTCEEFLNKARGMHHHGCCPGHKSKENLDIDWKKSFHNLARYAKVDTQLLSFLVAKGN